MADIFEKAIRRKLRFDFKGVQTVESLWDLKLDDLNTIYIALEDLVDSKSRGLMVKKNPADSDNALKLEIVKHVYTTKEAEAEASKKAAETRAKNARIKELIAKKEDGELEGKSLEELRKLIAED